VAPDLAAEIGIRLGVLIKYMSFDKPSESADAAAAGTCDVCFVAAEPARAEKIAFTAAYAEIEATYLVPPSSSLTLADADRDGICIVSVAGAAYPLARSQFATCQVDQS
jgi:polar amino acid transport system substrate-binding protein